jgi:hypothetical protein
MKELAILVLVRVEEKSEIVEYVIEEVVDNDTSLDIPGQSVNELISFSYFLKSVFGPVVLKMSIDLSVKRVRQRPVLTESSNESHPIMKLKSLAFDSRLVERANNFYEPSHDEREKSHTTKHDHHHDQLLIFGDRVEVTIANCRQSGD